MKNAPLVIEKIYNAPIDMVWKAITDNNAMKHWYFDMGDFKPVVGCEFRFEVIGGECKNANVHLCKVTEVLIGKKIAYTWRYDGFEGNSTVTWELFDEADGTRLKLTHEGLETFPVNNLDFGNKKFAESWAYLLGENLMNYLQPHTIQKS